MAPTGPQAHAPVGCPALPPALLSIMRLAELLVALLGLSFLMGLATMMRSRT
jgi:hypothetical protein